MKKIYIMLIIILSFIFYPITNAQASNDSSQITINLKVPDDFGLDCYALLYNRDTMQDYTIEILKINKYKGRAKVEPGTYVVGLVSAHGDYSYQYPFDIINFEEKENPNDVIEFKLDKKQTKTLTYTLLNYDEIEQQIKETKEQILLEEKEALQKEFIKPKEEDVNELNKLIENEIKNQEEQEKVEEIEPTIIEEKPLNKKKANPFVFLIIFFPIILIVALVVVFILYKRFNH